MFQRDLQYQSIFEHEGRILMEAVKLLKPRCVLETGTNNGYATGWLAHGLEEGGQDYALHTCDARDIGDSWKANVPEIAHSKITFHFKTSLMILEGSGLKFDFVFLDGQHDAVVVCEELRLIEVGQDGGPVVFVHDVRDHSIPSPLRGIEQYCELLAKTGQTANIYHVGEGTSLATNMDEKLLRQAVQKAKIETAG